MFRFFGNIIVERLQTTWRFRAGALTGEAVRVGAQEPFYEVYIKEEEYIKRHRLANRLGID